MARAILRIVNKSASPAGWAVRSARDKPPLAVTSTKQAAVDLAKGHLSAAAGGGTLEVYLANGGLERTQSFEVRTDTTSRRPAVSTAIPSKLTGSTEVRRLIDGLGSPDLGTESAVALLGTEFAGGKIPAKTVQTWAALGEASRSILLEDVRALLRSDASAAFGLAVDLLLAVAGLPPAAARVRATALAILANEHETIATLRAMQGSLQRVEAKIDEGVLLTARAAISHLIHAARATGEKTVDKELHMAAHKFTDLANLDPAETTKGTSGAVPNAELIVLGHWGSHVCHDLQKEHRLALLEAYQCVAEHPLESVMRFHRDYFGRDYRTEATDQQKILDAARNELRNAQGARRAGRMVTGGIATAASLFVFPPLAWVTGALTVGAAVSTGRIEPFQGRMEKAQARLDSISAQIVAEAERKCNALKSITGGDFELLASIAR